MEKDQQQPNNPKSPKEEKEEKEKVPYIQTVLKDIPQVDYSILKSMPPQSVISSTAGVEQTIFAAILSIETKLQTINDALTKMEKEKKEKKVTWRENICCCGSKCYSLTMVILGFFAVLASWVTLVIYLSYYSKEWQKAPIISVLSFSYSFFVYLQRLFFN